MFGEGYKPSKQKLYTIFYRYKSLEGDCGENVHIATRTKGQWHGERYVNSDPEECINMWDKLGECWAVSPKQAIARLCFATDTDMRIYDDGHRLIWGNEFKVELNNEIVYRTYVG